jgi:hypothetical protein
MKRLLAEMFCTMAVVCYALSAFLDEEKTKAEIMEFVRALNIKLK